MNLVTSTQALVALFCLAHPADAFTSTTRTSIRSGNVIRTSRLYANSNEKLLRDEIQEKSTKVDAEDEIKYGVTIGEGAAEDGERELEEEKKSEYRAKGIQKQIERAIKPRAYPLFLAEKAAILGEEVLGSVFSNGESYFQGEKEKIVVLGTGWGSAAFLKEIDMNRFDVTIVSPRNFFLFTPMLAGASVGTVEYRSITESIRQVSSCPFSF